MCRTTSSCVSSTEAVVPKPQPKHQPDKPNVTPHATLHCNTFLSTTPSVLWGSNPSIVSNCCGFAAVGTLSPTTMNPPPQGVFSFLAP
mmetsp:Transcript_74367/g.131351  ORF Transcript_74367/g.131351 Transcript_74367/m.131351 type:complete len:88 (-) Transcript_74367:45-308(-)